MNVELVGCSGVRNVVGHLVVFVVRILVSPVVAGHLVVIITVS